MAAPTAAKGLFAAGNADKVDGYHAKQLSKVQYWGSDTDFDNFDSCPYVTVMKRTFAAPAAGKIVLNGQVNAGRDGDDPDPAALAVRILVDGKVATAPGIARLVNNSVREASATTIGGAKVARGKRTLKLQASECTVGMAYLVSESMTVTFSPSGGTGTPPAFRGDGH